MLQNEQLNESDITKSSNKFNGFFDSETKTKIPYNPAGKKMNLIPQVPWQRFDGSPSPTMALDKTNQIKYLDEK